VEVVHRRCCGLDVHKKTVVACVLVSQPNGPPHREIRTFGTYTNEVLALANWLAEQGVTHVALESTGVYWKPIWNLLEDRFALLLVNPRHIKAVPGRKTDVLDAEWLAELLRYGLLKASFVPDRAQRELRELTRYRTSLINERSAAVNRLQKTLEGANIKLASVASDVMGLSARQMLAAVVEGTTLDTKALTDLAHGKLRDKLPQLEQALSGRVGPHQRFLLAEQLAHIDALDASIDRLDAEVAERLRPFDDVIDRLDAIPGIGRIIAEVLLAEIGVDMTRFPTANHLASWAGMCPGQNESAGKRRSGKTRKGSPWLRAALVQAAHAAAHSKQSYLAAQYRRLTARRGTKKAAVAVGHSILVTVYHLLTEPDCPYVDLGPTYFDQRAPSVVQRRLVYRLEGLGFKVQLSPLAESPAA
jgi:transposase